MYDSRESEIAGGLMLYLNDFENGVRELERTVTEQPDQPIGRYSIARVAQAGSNAAMQFFSYFTFLDNCFQPGKRPYEKRLGWMGSWSGQLRGGTDRLREASDFFLVKTLDAVVQQIEAGVQQRKEEHDRRSAEYAAHKR